MKFFNSLNSKIAYEQVHGGGASILWLGGLHSSMAGAKISFFREFCQQNDLGITCFDYFAHGQSEGNLEDASIGVWFRNSLDALDQLTAGRQIIVGFSMGGWMALLLALNRPEKVEAVFGVNIAPDFTEDIYKSLSYFQKFELKSGSSLDVGLGLPVSKAFIADGKSYLVLNKKRLSLGCPLHLFHGMEDTVAPYSKSIKVLKKATSTESRLLLMKGVDHRLSIEVFEDEVVTRIKKYVFQRSAPA